jgi:hypothetical protein
MQRRKSPRHVKAANARWRNAERRAQAERDAGIPDRAAPADQRQPITFDLSSYGGRRLRIEPRIGYIACRVIDDETGEIIDCAAIKTALHRIADALPATLGARA